MSQPSSPRRRQLFYIFLALACLGSILNSGVGLWSSSSSGPGNSSITNRSNAENNAIAVLVLRSAQQQQERIIPKQVNPQRRSSTRRSSDELFLQRSNTDLWSNDVFAASWWQTTERFLECDPAEQIRSVEDDAFVPIRRAGKGLADARMTRDLLDFNVEHLSRWWKYAGGEAPAYAMDKLNNYSQRIFSSLSQPIPQDTYMNTTIAVIPYGVKKTTSTQSQQLWAAALQSTIISVLNHGVARIVVVGHYETDETLARQVFEQLSGRVVDKSDYEDVDRHFTTRVMRTNSELAFVHTDNVNSTDVLINVPRGALVGLHDALAGRSDNAARYLGNRAPHSSKGGTTTTYPFEYVFLTEADQILNARITPEFWTEMQPPINGIIIPHRVQPMLHPQDLHGLTLAPYVNSLPHHKTVIALDASQGDGCCDTGQHQIGYQQVCKSLWFQCDYYTINATFAHLDDYDFITLTTGTGIVALAGNQHSRRCIPKRNNNNKDGVVC